ncbi:MAG: hypothetical protein WD250_12700, partial [Egibacteraceae bacterium]
MRTKVQAGAGLVARAGDGLLVAPGEVSMDSLQPLLTTLDEVCGTEAGAGRNLVRRVVGHLVTADPEAVPDFAVLAPTGEGWAVLLHGAVELVIVRAAGEERLDGRAAATWVDRLLPADVTGFAAGAPGVTAGEPPGPFDLRAGIVPGAGAVMAAGAATGAPPAAHRPVAPAGAAAPP